MNLSDLPGNDRRYLILKLNSIAGLSPDDTQALVGLPVTEKSYPQDCDIVREGDRPGECCLVLEGLVCRYKLVADGKRQIMSFHTPGDIPDLQSFLLRTMDHSLGTLAPTRVAFIPHNAIQEVVRDYPGVATAFWRDTLIDAAIFREWLVGVGRRSAHTRIAHLLCEMQRRFAAVGLGDQSAYNFPVTQAEVGDALGLSNVHVNRVLMDLKKNGLVTVRDGNVVIHDWAGLARVGEFDPAYLHQKLSETAA